MQHEAAAKAHRTAAGRHDEAGHATTRARSTKAHEASARARTHCAAAHGKSTAAAQAAPSPAGGGSGPARYCPGRSRPANSGKGVDPSGVPSRPAASIMATVT